MAGRRPTTNWPLLDEDTNVLENDKAIDPRTSNMGDLPMSSPPAATVEAGLPTEIKPEEKTMAMLCHLLGIVTWFLGALIIWLIKKDQSKFVDDQGKETLKFQLTLFIRD